MAHRDGSAGRNLDRLREVLAPLDQDKKSRLFELVRAGHLRNEQMTSQITRLLIDMLNGRRTEHARRLWTRWFDPILVRDDVPLLAEARLPGCLHFVDASAWWFTLSPHFRLLVQRIQKDVAQRSREQPINAVLATPEAREWAEELRRQSLAVLRAHQPDRMQMLATANTERNRLLRSRGITRAAPLTASDLELLETMLEGAPAWPPPPRPDDGAEVLRITAEMRERGTATPETVLLYGMAHLHATREPAFAHALNRLFPHPLLHAAMVAHLQLACHLLSQKLAELCLGQPGSPGTLSGTDTATVLMDRAFAWYDLVQELQLDQNPRYRSAVADTVGRMIDLAEVDLVGAVTQRILALSPSRSPETLIEGVNFIMAFKHNLLRRDFATTDKPWLPAAGEHLLKMFRKVASNGRVEDLRLLALIFELSEAIRYPIEITAIDQVLLGLVERALRERPDLDAVEQRLVKRVLDVSEAEWRKCKWWVSGEVIQLLETARRTKLGADLLGAEQIPS